MSGDRGEGGEQKGLLSPSSSAEDLERCTVQAVCKHGRQIERLVPLRGLELFVQNHRPTCLDLSFARALTFEHLKPVLKVAVQCGLQRIVLPALPELHQAMNARVVRKGGSVYSVISVSVPSLVLRDGAYVECNDGVAMLVSEKELEDPSFTERGFQFLETVFALPKGTLVAIPSESHSSAMWVFQKIDSREFERPEFRGNRAVDSEDEEVGVDYTPLRQSWCDSIRDACERAVWGILGK